MTATFHKLNLSWTLRHIKSSSQRLYLNTSSNRQKKMKQICIILEQIIDGSCWEKRRRAHKGNFISGQRRGGGECVYRENITAGVCVRVFWRVYVCAIPISHACSLSESLHRLTYFLFTSLSPDLLPCKHCKSLTLVLESVVKLCFRSDYSHT